MSAPPRKIITVSAPGGRPPVVIVLLAIAVTAQLLFLAWLFAKNTFPKPGTAARVETGATVAEPPVRREDKPELKMEGFVPHPKVPRERLGTLFAAMVKLGSAPGVRLSARQRAGALEILAWTRERELAWFVGRAVIPLHMTAAQYRLLEEKREARPFGGGRAYLSRALALLAAKAGVSVRDAERAAPRITLKEGGAMHDLHRIARVIVEAESDPALRMTGEQAEKILPLLAGAFDFELHRVLAKARYRFYGALTPRQLAFINENAESWDRDPSLPNYADVPRFRRLAELVVPLMGPDDSVDLLPDSAGGIRKKGREALYRESELYGFIDGEADLFVLYGYRHMRVQRYAGSSAELELQAAALDSALDAFGLFSRYTAEHGAFLDVGAEGWGDPSMLCFHKGRYFVRILALRGGSVEAMARLARETAACLPDEGGGAPCELAFFPTEGLVRSSIRYAPRDLLGRRFFPRGFEASYRGGGRAFVAVCGDEREAAAAAASFRASGDGVVVAEGRYCAGVTGVADRGKAQELCGRLADRIRSAGSL